MTKNEKIIFYNKIEKALTIEYPILLAGLSKVEIEELISNAPCINDKCIDKLKEFVNNLDEPVTAAYLVSELLGILNIHYRKDNTITEAFPIILSDGEEIEPVNNQTTIKFAYLGETVYTVRFPLPIYEIIDSKDNSYVKIDKNSFSIKITNMEPKDITVDWINTEENNDSNDSKTDNTNLNSGKYFGQLGLIGGGYLGSSDTLTVEQINIVNGGNCTDFGILTVARRALASSSNGTIGLFVGGANNDGVSNIVDKITICTNNNAVDFGDIILSRDRLTSCSDGTVSLIGGGLDALGNRVFSIDKLIFDTGGKATDFGNLTEKKYGLASCSDGTTGLFGGGTYSVPFSAIDKVTMASEGNAVYFGDLTIAKEYLASCSNDTIGLFSGGDDSNNKLNDIDKVTIATDSNATDFGYLMVARNKLTSSTDGTTAIFIGGIDSNNVYLNSIDRVTIATDSNATDFSDLVRGRSDTASCSGC